MERVIKEIALVFGGWATIVTAIAVWGSHLASKRIINSWDVKSQRDFAELRHIQSETQLLLKEISSTITSSQSLLQTRRLEAVDILWRAILALRDHFSFVTIFFSIFQPNEYSSAMSNPTLSVGLREIDDNYITDCLKNIKDLESQRPYLGETLWLLFFIYRAFLARLAYLVTLLNEGKEIKDWREDTGIRHHLAAVFDKDEFEIVMSMSPIPINHPTSGKAGGMKL